MQSGYGEQTLSNKKNFIYYWKNFRPFSDFFQKRGFVIFLTGATETDFFRLVGETTWQ